MRLPHLLATSALLLAVTLAGACRPSNTNPSAGPQYVATATIKDLMQSMIDPAADAVWLSVTTVQTATGVEETKPTTDEDWRKVRAGALTLAESANLLMMPGRHVARPGEKSEAPGVELEPDEMDVLIARDPEGWNQRAAALHEAAVAVLAAVDAHDADKVFELGERIERSCEHCHAQYWYPNEKIPPVEIK